MLRNMLISMVLVAAMALPVYGEQKVAMVVSDPQTAGMANRVFYVVAVENLVFVMEGAPYYLEKGSKVVVELIERSQRARYVAYKIK